MRFNLKPEAREEFENRIGTMGPWFHSYSFGPDIFTGFYKYDGLGWQNTWCNSSSSPDLIAKMRDAYARRDLEPWRQTIFESLKLLDLNPAESTALDISSASGRNSFILCDYGFRKVFASEIRAGSHGQHRLMLDSIADGDYAQRTVTINDPVSADAAEFPTKYESEGIDVVCSFHLLYHLANPIQHLINLKRIARKFALVFTKTQLEIGLGINGRRGWIPIVEASDDIANAVAGVGWTPHMFDVPTAASRAGFDLVAVKYPAPFAANFPYYNARPRTVYGRMILDKLATKLLRRPVGHLKNFDPAYHGPLHLHPSYYMYVFRSTDRGVRFG
jgi:hypothetical protein